VETITFEIPGVPVAKGRPRFGKGRAYTPRKTRNAENRIADAALKAMGRTGPWLGPVDVFIVFYFPIPKSFPKHEKIDSVAGGIRPLCKPEIDNLALAVAGGIRPVCKPDIDNLAKAVMDACNGIVYRDDSQVVEMTVRKWFCETPSTRVSVRFL
jgi:Holliday junction resolvase RusA-like endonuclease